MSDMDWLLGVVHGDGCIQKYFVEISDEHERNLSIVRDVVKKLFGKEAKITKDRSENRFRLWINSKSIAENLGSRTPKNLISYIQGLFDAEGYVEFHKPTNSIRINFSTANSKLAKFVLEFFISKGYRPYFRYSSKAWRVQLYRKKDVVRFSREIGFRYPTKKEKLRSLLQRKAET